ncbi:MAG: hypothetical protein M3171_13845, partial [Actinomycetota bacterium]|nr:hypothetical protein [Actinomycetota bacterium]
MDEPQGDLAAAAQAREVDAALLRVGFLVVTGTVSTLPSGRGWLPPGWRPTPTPTPTPRRHRRAPPTRTVLLRNDYAPRGRGRLPARAAGRNARRPTPAGPSSDGVRLEL